MLSAGYLKDAMAAIFFALMLIYLVVYRTVPYAAVFFIVLTGFLVDTTFTSHPTFHNEPIDPRRPATQVTFAFPIMVIIVFYAFRKSLFTITTPK
jgi:energy-coupling factor transporter transmembrane protein EcfT